MKLKLITLVSLFALGFALNAHAGAVADADTDLVPDQYDNCDGVANGPGELSNQVDSDLDGYGNACDADYVDAGFAVNVADFAIFLAAFQGGPTTVTDHDGDGATAVSDFAVFLAAFQAPVGSQVGPSGLACAGVTNPCVP
ncbi:MAG: hypothetical protein GY910_22655 [bacterium]|jgi:hypothetical protein|nr:hypothetical protein [Deltaproteobacteria bacterium]MCP4907784.1 hypothetical protein [bacterium]